MLLRVASILVMSSVASPASAAVEEDDASKQRRIEWFQERRLVIDEASPNPNDKPAGNQESTSKPLVLRQGPDRIYHGDFVELIGDPSLTRDWELQLTKDWAWWLGSGAVGIPLGSLLFLQNFRGTGQLAPFYDAARTEGANAGDLRSYTLSVSGIALALYGAYSLGLWVSESLDWYHPDRLEAVSIRGRVKEWNEKLAERANLERSDWPSPPPPRPSASPTPSASPGATPAPLPMATTPVGGPDASPYGRDIPTMPTPLPLISPGAFPSPLPNRPGRAPFFQELGTPQTPNP